MAYVQLLRVLAVGYTIGHVVVMKNVPSQLLRSVLLQYVQYGTENLSIGRINRGVQIRTAELHSGGDTTEGNLGAPAHLHCIIIAVLLLIVTLIGA